MYTEELEHEILSLRQQNSQLQKQLSYYTSEFNATITQLELNAMQGNLIRCL
ncbi:hypothetical protein FBB35_00320 [Nostoc sp. TCL240-02]|nr:hypothetical protein FBB35_00320 [Nostoc sp. TCL240-02]